jgi:hypothetical protein
MRDNAAGTIWRDIRVEEGAVTKRLRDISEILGIGDDRETSPSLRLNRETRPYEWGWCLLAGAMLTQPVRDGHLA